MSDTNYNFPVELQPIFLPNGQEIVNRKAVVRTDSMTSLGIVSNDYSLVKHGAVVDSFREASREYNVKEEIGLVKDEAFLYYKMTFPKVEAEIAKGDIVRMQMIARNSYNGMNALQIIFGALRLVCLNGMVLGTQFMQFQYRHIGDINRATIDDYKDAFVHYIHLFGQRMPVVTAMSRTPLLEPEKMFAKEVVALPEYLRKEAVLSFEANKDRSVWGYYNSLTYAITHKMRHESPGLAINYGMEAWKTAERLVN